MGAHWRQKQRHENGFEKKRRTHDLALGMLFVRAILPAPLLSGGAVCRSIPMGIFYASLSLGLAADSDSARQNSALGLREPSPF